MTKRNGLSRIKWNEALTGYFWYSGIVVQFAVVLIGLQTFSGLFERRPTHRLARAISEKLTDTKNCTFQFRGTPFSWLDPQSFTTEEVSASGAELIKLTYRNLGSMGITPEGYHLYRVVFEASIKDTSTGEIVVFPPLAEQLMQVNSDSRVVTCSPEISNGTRSDSTQVQEVSMKPCETPGWSRRFLCDRGTNRCYPMAQCEPLNGGS